MTKQVKMHTIELTEHELARVLFVMYVVNGTNDGRRITSLAFEKLDLNRVGAWALDSKMKELAGKANLPELIDYYSIQKEWETYLGVGITDENKVILDKIAKLEKELAELTEML